MPELAVFDVDETILTIKGLFSFAEYFFCQYDGADGLVQGQPFADWLAGLRASARSQSREQVNRLFYTAFANQSAARMERCAQAWCARLIQSGQGTFVQATLSALQWYRGRGVPVVFLSGSARLFLSPLAKVLDATHVLAIELEVDDTGTLTGAILPPQTIGDGKWQALAAFLDKAGIAAGDCIGYGDHPTDLPFLIRLGEAVIVEGNEEMEDLAAAHGWSILPRVAIDFPAPSRDLSGARRSLPSS